MTKKSRTIIAFLIISVIFLVMFEYKASATPRIIEVPSVGYETIQKAIDAASTGDVIMVSAGTYRENLIIRKNIALIGENPETTIIDGGDSADVVIITNTQNVTISGFTIQNGKKEYPYSGIRISRSTNTTIINVILRYNYYGLELMQSNWSKVDNNIISNNIYAGIYAHASSTKNIFAGNTIKYNNIGLWSDSAPQNTFYHNNFINNTQHLMIFNSPTKWDNGYPAGGNYWSDYSGSDLYSGPSQNITGSDGIGDTKYVRTGVEDKYPLIGVFTSFTISYYSQKSTLLMICNSTISNLTFDQNQQKITFDVRGHSSKKGFLRLDLPSSLIQRKCKITLDGESIDPINNWTDSAYSYRCYLYQHTGTAQKVTIEVELERPQSSWTTIMIAALLIIAAFILAIIIYNFKKR